jgi:hypothetical protein
MSEGKNYIGILFRGVGTMSLLLVALFPLAAMARAEENTHFFNATLSLTGDCSTSFADQIEDPGCPGGEHPPLPIQMPRGTATDSFGNRYVASYGTNASGNTDGRVDVFSPSGRFITEVAVCGPTSVAVDSEGYMYAVEYCNPPGGRIERLSRYDPTLYHGAQGEIEYSTVPIPLHAPQYTAGSGVYTLVDSPLRINGNCQVVIDPENDRLYLDLGRWVGLIGSKSEGNQLIKWGSDPLFPEGSEGTGIGLGDFPPDGEGKHLAVDAAHNRLYVTTFTGGGSTPETPEVLVFELAAPYDLIGTIDGSGVPGGTFTSGSFDFSVAAEEETGHLFVGDLGGAKKRVYELEPDGTLVSIIEHSFQKSGGGNIAIDNGSQSPTKNYLFVPSGEGSPSRSYAFEPKPVVKAPVVSGLSVTGVTEDEAVLKADVNPEGAETTYRIEYTTQARFEAEGFSAATVAGEGTLKAETEPIPVSAAALGLAPGTSYRFLVTAVGSGEASAESTFTTYRGSDSSLDCPNSQLRVGASAELPDCRAYELVTPPNTNGHAPNGTGSLGIYFPSPRTSPAGDKVTFSVEGGTIPGIPGGTGSLGGEPYLSTRGTAGWTTSDVGPSGTEAYNALVGSFSTDQGFSFWETNGGAASIEGKNTVYLRFPDGHSELLGSGPSGSDPATKPHYISEDGNHVIFSSAVRLVPEAPADGITAIYDRPAGGTPQLISVLPEGAAAGSAIYLGASPDGAGVAFAETGAGSPLYLRLDGTTHLAAPAGSTFEGLAEGGKRLFYLSGGDLFAYDAASNGAIRFSESGDVVPVNVASDGSVAYFVSQSVLTPAANPLGAVAEAGRENLYLSREGSIRFVAAVSKRDVEGVKLKDNSFARGLGLWGNAQIAGMYSIDSSRSTGDGSVLMFESNAGLTDTSTFGHTEIYRFDLEAETLSCLSCNPVGTSTGESSIQSFHATIGEEPALSRFDVAGNLTAGGRRAFFESTEPLVLRDTDGLRDVYEWEEDGLGSCRTPGGCVYLISSGTSAHPNYLFAVSSDGQDVFIRTADLLLPALDPDETPSIYDARVNGGFPPPASAAGECLGEACQPEATAPAELTPPTFETAGNVAPAKSHRCSKAKRRVLSHGKTKCVLRKKHNPHHHAKRRTHR